jgi:hypothetical protein
MRVFGLHGDVPDVHGELGRRVGRGLAMAKRRVELFTAGCRCANQPCRSLNEFACVDCEIIVYNLTEGGAEAGSGYGIKTLPAVVVTDASVSCCDNRGPRPPQSSPPSVRL